MVCRYLRGEVKFGYPVHNLILDHPANQEGEGGAVFDAHPVLGADAGFGAGPGS